VVLLLLEPEAGDALLLVLVFVELLLELLAPAGLLPPAGLLLSTTVVLLLLPLAGGLVVSDFCSHAARSAALAMMQMYFFIGFGCPRGSMVKSKRNRRADLRLTN
jgi:hypothetical protein